MEIETGNDVEQALAALLPRFRERERDLDVNSTMAVANLDDLRQSGMLRLNVPTIAGGLGADLALSLDVLRRVAGVAPSTALMLAMHNSTIANYLVNPQSLPAASRSAFEDQRQWVWKEAVAGKIFGVANSEPGTNGDVRQSRTSLSADRATVSGVKSFASMGLSSAYFMVAARDPEGAVDYYLVRNDPEHVKVENEWDATGMRSSESVTLRFIGAAVLGPLGYAGLLDGPNKRHWSTLSFTAIFLGIAESLLDDLVRASSAMLQKVECVDLHLTLQACRGFIQRCVAEERDVVDDRYLALVRDCKLFVTRSLADRAAAAVNVQGGAVYRFSSPVSRKFRDLMAGPLLRPPVGGAFEKIWDDLAARMA